VSASTTAPTRPAPEPAGSGSEVGRRSSRRSSRFAPYVFVSPFYVLFGLFLLIPIIVGFYLSLTEWAGFGDPEWVGLDNYERLFSDRQFFQSLRNTAVFVLVSMVIVVPLALLVAQALNARGLRLRDLFRFIYFTPIVLSPIIIALVFQLMYDRNFGVFNAILRAVFGFGGIDWLGSAVWAKVSVSILIVWRWTGYLTIFFLVVCRRYVLGYMR